MVRTVHLPSSFREIERSASCFADLWSEEQHRGVYKRFARNGDGKLSNDELIAYKSPRYGNGRKPRGFYPRNRALHVDPVVPYTKEAYQNFFLGRDKNLDGEQSKDAAASANKDGCIGEYELINHVEHGKQPCKVSTEASGTLQGRTQGSLAFGNSDCVGRALRHADSNGDGIISNEELNDLNYSLTCGYKL